MIDLNETSEPGVRDERTKPLPPLQVLLGTSRASQELLRNLRVISGTDLAVLLQGEAGTEKEAVARWIHRLSPLSNQRFVKANPSTIDEFLRSLGLQNRSWEEGIAETGDLAELTLFVEDVETLNHRMQAALARMVQEPSSYGFRRSRGRGGVRLISATQRDLKGDLFTGSLRPDFFHSISAFTVRLVPLRNRVGELPELVAHFLEVHGSELNISPRPLSPETYRVLEEYGWPGNLRELEDMLIGYVLTGSEAMLVEKVLALQRGAKRESGELLEEQEGDTVVRAAAPMGIQELADDVILRALRENGWNRRQTARRLQVSYRSLLYKLKKMDIASGYRPAYRVAASR